MRKPFYRTKVFRSRRQTTSHDDFIDIAGYEEMGAHNGLYYFKTCMTGRAREWFDFQEFENFEEAMIKFRGKYCRVDQTKFRDLLYNGLYSDEWAERWPSILKSLPVTRSI